jgi:hypothetical protein
MFSKGVGGSWVVVPANFWTSFELKDHEVLQNPFVTPNFFLILLICYKVLSMMHGGMGSLA